MGNRLYFTTPELYMWANLDPRKCDFDFTNGVEYRIGDQIFKEDSDEFRKLITMLVLEAPPIKDFG